MKHGDDDAPSNSNCHYVRAAGPAPTRHVHLEWPRKSKRFVDVALITSLVKPLGATRVALDASCRFGGATFPSIAEASAAIAALDGAAVVRGRRIYARHADALTAAEKVREKLFFFNSSI